MASPQDIINNGNTGGTTVPTSGNMIRNISQTVQEREIVKTAPDVVVFIEGLPYLINPFVNDPKNGHLTTLVNFNDHVTEFSATYDTDAMVPNCTVQLQVPNYSKYLYQMPGGNNVLQTMSQIQVYAKSYYMAAGTGDTVYRRVFKGVTSNISYNDNGKTLEISIQCHGIMHLLEKMQTNIHPSVNTSHHTGVSQTIWQSKYASGNCFEVLAAVFLDGLHSDMFQIGSLLQAAQDPFQQAVERGFMAKWQSILWNMVKDVHIFGPYKDLSGQASPMKKNQSWGAQDDNIQSSGVTKTSKQSEKDLVAEYQTYYGLIQTYFPFRNITALDLENSVIVNRLDIIREVVQKMDYEAYQDVDGKIIIKPPLYNLDVVNLGTRTKQTQTGPNSSNNSLSNPATAIYESNNPFVVYLSEMLTEQESEDQAAIRRTRTTVVGNVLKSLGNDYKAFFSQVGEYIDISKLAKFGLREEPLYQVPWIQEGDKQTLFVHAAAETARANRGYRTYSFSIPMRPELKLGFPVFIPHKDMYAYIKTISLNYSVGGTATMTVTCDSVRRRVLVNTQQTKGSGNSATTFAAYTPAPNLIYQWTKASTDTQQANALSPNPDSSPSNAQIRANLAINYAAGTISGVSNDSTNDSTQVGTSQSLATPVNNPDGTPTSTPAQIKLYSVKTQGLVSKMGNQFDTEFATYVIKNDGNQQQGTMDPNVGKNIVVNGKSYKNTNPGPGFFTAQRPADFSYIQALTGKPNAPTTNSVIPFTDDKGYELISPFPWGRWTDLNTAVRMFTQAGFLPQAVDANGNPIQISQDDLRTLQNTEAFLFAGLGTPSATGDPSTQLQTALNNQQQLVGGSLTGDYASQATSTPAAGTPIQKTAQGSAKGGLQKSVSQPDATVIILHYDPMQPGSNADNTLLNSAQPENKFAEQLLANTQNALQQTVNVLVSGEVSPTPAVQEALLAAQTQPTQPQNVQLLNQITK
jgi:hypothetical protein